MHPSAPGMPLRAEEQRPRRQGGRNRCACPHRGTVLWMTVLGELRRELGLYLPLLSRTSQPLPVLQRSTPAQVQVQARVQAQVRVRVQAQVRVRVQARVPARVQARVPENRRGQHICRSPQRPR